MKIRHVGAELFHADRRTDMTMLIVAFRKFANTSKNFSNHTQHTAILKIFPRIRSIYRLKKPLYRALFWKKKL